METRVEHHDVLIVGAGLSGIGAACQLRAKCPGRTFAILEARDAIGGTWDLFRYPGIRSDSDMYTLGYSFKPWKDRKSIADGPSILRYIRETAREHGIEPAIRFGRRVLSASWSTAKAVWEVEVERLDTGARVMMTCNFLHMCTGYYDYASGYTPAFRDMERFRGTLIHPQHWPEDFDYSGLRVLVIGSGATAVTLVPAMAGRAAHVTMLQRSPSYVLSVPTRDPVADALRRRLPPSVAYALVRWKNALTMTALFHASRRWPQRMRNLLTRGARRALPDGFDVRTHFNPSYDPWDQRLCFVPDGDLFEALSSGGASVVTEEIDRFTENGVRLASGREIEADVIVTATGLQLKLLGGLQLTVDGGAVDFADTVAYKGMMFSGVPNLALAFGYTNASWTLKCDLVSDYVCRLLNHMDAHGYHRCMPLEPPPTLAREPLMNLNSGYINRARAIMPTQGARPPWRLHQNYLLDVRMLRRGQLEDEGVEFSARPIGAARISSGMPNASTSAAA